jgi:hypothetical protein
MAEQLEEILRLIDEFDLVKVFEKTDELGINNSDLSRLKKAFISGVSQNDPDYVDRLKLWAKNYFNPTIEAQVGDNDKPTMVITKNITVPADGSDFGFSQTLINLDGVFKIDQKNFTPKKILFVCTGANDKNPFDFGQEFKKIKDALQSSQKREQFEVEIETGVEADDFLRVVTRYQPDILHIATHSSDNQGVYFQNSAGETQSFSPEELADVFALMQKKFTPELVILSACNSIAQAEAIQPYVGQAIAMQDLWPEEAGLSYAENLYEMIFDGQDINYAHESAVLGVKMAKIAPLGKTKTHEVPVLFGILSKPYKVNN